MTDKESQRSDEPMPIGEDEVLEFNGKKMLLIRAPVVETKPWKRREPKDNKV